MAIPASMTELEAVNILLTTIGEAPVNTLTGNQVTDVSIANQVLNEVSREVQSQGWHFNTEERVPLTPDSNSQIPMPANVARIDVTNFNAVVKSEKLFDLTERSYNFTDVVYADIVFYQDFQELPDVAKRYITVRAARIYSDRMVNSQIIHAMTIKDEELALINLREYEGDTADFNMMDSYSVARVMNRGNTRRILM